MRDHAEKQDQVRRLVPSITILGARCSLGVREGAPGINITPSPTTEISLVGTCIMPGTHITSNGPEASPSFPPPLVDLYKILDFMSEIFFSKEFPLEIVQFTFDTIAASRAHRNLFSNTLAKFRYEFSSYTILTGVGCKNKIMGIEIGTVGNSTVKRG